MKKFEVREVNGDDESWHAIAAFDAEAAAESFCEEIEPYSEGATEFETEVREVGSAEIERWNVSVEHEPVFYASKAKDL
jgi:hypothetical protein